MIQLAPPLPDCELTRITRPDEIVTLFKNAYHLDVSEEGSRKKGMFELIDYDITADRSQSPAPPEPGKTQSTRNLRRKFKGVVAIDGHEHAISGTGNGAISSFANALKSLGVDLDVSSYTENAIGEGKTVKAATFIECITSGNEKSRVWGVGIHQDVVTGSLMALLSCANSV